MQNYKKNYIYTKKKYNTNSIYNYIGVSMLRSKQKKLQAITNDCESYLRFIICKNKIYIFVNYHKSTTNQPI